MKIVSGRTGSPHVTSQQFRQMLEGIIGQGSYIITSGENLKPELSSNNLLKIRSGMMAHHGCISCVDIGTYDEVTLTNGSQGMKRIDLIVNRYTRNAETEVENCSWKVIMGTPAASNPTVPSYTKGNLQNGDTVDDCPIFEVHYDGINVAEVKSLLSVTDGLSGLSSKLCFETGAMKISGTPKGCGASISGNYVRIGKMVFIQCEIKLSNTGTDKTTPVAIPCLPYPAKQHSTFGCGYQTCVIKANATSENSVLKAGAYGNSKELIFYSSYGGRTWTVMQNEIITSNTVVLVGGSYIIAD